MTLIEIISAALQQLGYTTDAQTQKIWRAKFTQLANEGMVDLSEAINLRRTDSISVSNGEISIGDLPYECMKVLKISQDGTEITMSKGKATDKIAVSATGSVDVEYRYLPNNMSSDTDKPGIPTHLHSLIVTYICACHHMTANVDTQGRYNAVYNKYLSGKTKARKHYGEPENYKIINKGW